MTAFAAALNSAGLTEDQAAIDAQATFIAQVLTDSGRELIV